MAMKMECDNCGTQVTAEGLGNHGWIIINEVQVVAQMGHAPISGSLCTLTCALEFLRKREPTPIEGEPG